MKKLIVIVAWLLFPALSQAHIDGHAPEPTAVKPLTCYNLAARATWGAYAQGVGAPAEFKYVAYSKLRQIFFGTRADLPTDGIYLLEDMNADEREEYQRWALIGYEWAQSNSAPRDHEQLMAVFVDRFCSNN